MTPAARAALIACAGFAALSLLFSGRVTREMVDLEVYWTAARRAVAAEPLYRAEDQHYQFKYLPAFAVLSAPLGAMPLPQAKAFWFTASVVLLVLLVALSLGLPAERRKPAWLLTLGTVAAMGKFFGHELVLGQVNALFAVLVVLALLALARGREAFGALLMVLAIVVKPYAVIFLPWLAARRRRASIAASVAGVTVVLLLPVPLYGVAGTLDLHWSWWRTVTESTAPNLTNNDNVSIAAMYAKWMGAGTTAAALSLATTLLLAAVVVVTLTRRRDVASRDGLEGALLLTCIPLLSPQGWDYVFLVSTPAVVYLLNYEDRLPAALRVVSLVALAVIGLSLFDVMGRAAYARFMALSVVTVCYFVVIAALCTLRMRSAA